MKPPCGLFDTMLRQQNPHIALLCAEPASLPCAKNPRNAIFILCRSGVYRLKKKWRDGTSHIIFQPLELMERLAALVPAPRFNMIRYSGVLAPSAEWRRRIIPKDIEAPGVSSAYTEKCGQNARVPGYTRERKHFPHLHGLFTVMLRQA